MPGPGWLTSASVPGAQALIAAADCDGISARPAPTPVGILFILFYWLVLEKRGKNKKTDECGEPMISSRHHHVKIMHSPSHLPLTAHHMHFYSLFWVFSDSDVIITQTRSSTQQIPPKKMCQLIIRGSVPPLVLCPANSHLDTYHTPDARSKGPSEQPSSMT